MVQSLLCCCSAIWKKSDDRTALCGAWLSLCSPGQPTLLCQTGGAGTSPRDSSDCHGHHPCLNDQGRNPRERHPVTGKDWLFRGSVRTLQYSASCGLVVGSDVIKWNLWLFVISSGPRWFISIYSSSRCRLARRPSLWRKRSMVLLWTGCRRPLSQSPGGWFRSVSGSF